MNLLIWMSRILSFESRLHRTKFEYFGNSKLSWSHLTRYGLPLNDSGKSVPPDRWATVKYILQNLGLLRRAKGQGTLHCVVEMLTSVLIIMRRQLSSLNTWNVNLLSLCFFRNKSQNCLPRVRLHYSPDQTRGSRKRRGVSCLNKCAHS